MLQVLAAVVATFPATTQAASSITGLLSEEIDLECVDDLNEDEVLVYGLAVVAQDAYHVLIEPRGSNLDDPDRGADVLNYLHRKDEPGFYASLPGRLGNAIEILPEVSGVEGTAKPVDGGQSVRVDLVIDTSRGPFDLVFELNPDKVTRIKGGT